MAQKFIIEKIDTLPCKRKIQGQDAKHIFKVLRLGPEDEIHVTDGNGHDYIAVITSVSFSTILLTITRQLSSKTESPVQIALCTALLKDKKMDLVIKHTTQLGINEWIPFFCQRSVPTPDEKRLKKRSQRWQTISNESLKQCRRSRKVNIIQPLNFEELMELSKGYDLKISFWEKSSKPLTSIKKHPEVSKIIIMIGPEGGFSKEEISTAQNNGFVSYSLGPRILRAETACISACTLIQHFLGDI